MFAKFSRTARAPPTCAQKRPRRDLASGRIVQITSDGGGDIINGTSELGERRGVRAARLLPVERWHAHRVWQFDTSGVERFTLINNADTLYPVVTQFP